MINLDQLTTSELFDLIQKIKQQLKKREQMIINSKKNRLSQDLNHHY
jgi:hypothetical protein